MPRPTAWNDEYTLLCERCGYVIEGLDQAGNCPECGKPIAESLPGRRVGTPWQQRPGVKSLVQTWWITLRHPLRTLDVMRFDEPRHMSLLLATLSSFTGVCWLITAVQIGVPRTANNGILDALLMAAVLAIIAAAFPVGLFLLTGIEAEGLQLFSRAKRTRITPAIAWSVVAHGAVGWGACFLIWLAALQITRFDTLLHPPADDFERRQQIIRHLDQIQIPGFVVGLLAGVLIFETFAYLGLRRCKYANRVQPANPNEPRP
ncbi:MAG: hypothetical protein WD114_00860 [Phycisphaerales bacterium]